MTFATGEEGFMGAVEGQLADAVGGPGELAGLPLLTRVASHLVLAPGAKRIRPWFVHWVGQRLGVSAERLVELASAVELVHAASLLHDDVVDEGQLRRGRPTANRQFGNDVAVLGGDFVLTRALQQLEAYPQALTVHAVKLVAEMTSGAILEVELRGQAHPDLARWREMADGKCGALFGFGARAVGLLAGRPDRAEALDQLGRRLGLAFQMADDLKDLLEVHGNKDRFADLRNKNPSFALWTVAAHDAGLRAELERLWAQPAVAASALGRVAELFVEAAPGAGVLRDFSFELSVLVDLGRASLGEEAVDDLRRLGKVLSMGLPVEART